MQEYMNTHRYVNTGGEDRRVNIRKKETKSRYKKYEGKKQNEQKKKAVKEKR